MRKVPSAPGPMRRSAGVAVLQVHVGRRPTVTSASPVFFTVTAVWIFSPLMIMPNFHTGGEKTTLGLPAVGNAAAQSSRRAGRSLAVTFTPCLPFVRSGRGVRAFLPAPCDEDRQEEQIEE